MMIAMKTTILLWLCVLWSHVRAQIANKPEEYLIKQGILSDGTIEMYSPYFLWHSDINNKSAALSSPLELRAINGYLDIRLHVRAVRINTGLFNYTSRAYCFNDACSVPGPTLYCRPGDRVKITLINELASIGGTSRAGPLEGHTLFPNRTNIFIQGVNLDPALNNPFRFTSGAGDSLVYEYMIPEDIHPGAHWYHSRVHGSAALQVMGGLFGAFIVEPTPITATADANGTYQYTAPLPKTLQAIRRQVVVLSHIMADRPTKSIPSVKGGTFSLIDEAGSDGFANSSLSFTYLSKAYGSTLPVDASYRGNTSLRDVWLVNGQYQPTLALQPGEWRVLDIVVASADRIVELEVRTAVGYGEGSLACDVRLLALDGVYLNTTRTGPTVTHLTLLQSARASVAITCPTPGLYYLQTATTFDPSDPQYIIGDFQTKSSQNLLTLNITGEVYIMSAPPFDLSSIVRPRPILSQHAPVTAAHALSLSTAQGGCCVRTDAPANVTADRCGARYWFGMGPDCRPACYGKLLCEALNSVLTTSGIDALDPSDGYTVRTFPTVRIGDCTYSSFSSYRRNGSHSQGAPCLGHHAVSDATVVAEARAVTDGFGSDTPVVHTGEVLALTLWGHADFPYPVFLQNHVMQLAAFANVDRGVSNIVDSGEYILQVDQNSSFYAQPGDFKELWPSLTGQSKLYWRAHEHTGSILVMTPFLKFEDLGALRHIVVAPSASHPDPDPSTTPTQPPSPTAAPTPTEPPVGVPPRNAQLNSDHAPAEFLCNTTGASFYYSEELDFTARVRRITTHSCPNHFSLCQGSGCGGSVATRALITRQVVSVPLYPAISTAPLDATCNDMLLGVALNGVGIYGVSDGKTDQCVDSLGYIASGGIGNYTRELVGRTACTRPSDYDGLRCCGDLVQAVATEIDKCGGHAGRDGAYKYLVTPTCLQKQLSPHKVRDHSPQLGWALDGFPVYGPIGAKGVEMKPCGSSGAHPVLCLDVCNGYAGRLPGYDQFTYRYYFSGDVGTGECSATVGNAGNCSRVESKCCVSSVPTKAYRPYTIGCFRGCPVDHAILRNGERINDHGAYTSCRLAGQPGTTGDYVPTEAHYATEVFTASNAVISVPDEEVPVSNPTPDPTTVASNPRKVITRNPFDGEMTILGFGTASSVTVEGGSADVVARETVPRSIKDAYITGMHVDGPDAETTYYTTQLAIYSYNLRTKATTTIIAGLVQVEIDGYNLGATLTDVSVTVGGQTCTSVVHVSPHRITCLVVLKEPNVLYAAVGSSRARVPPYVSSVSDLSSEAELATSIVPFTVSDVALQTTGGRTQGVNPLPLATARSGSGRPVMSHIVLTVLPFEPYTIAIAAHNETTSGSSRVSKKQTLYWSNVATGAQSIQRSRLDGSQVETVVTNVQRAVSLAVDVVILDAGMKVTTATTGAASCASLAADADTGVVTTLVVAQASDTPAQCTLTGHMLYFADAQLGTLSRLALFPISPAEVFQPVGAASQGGPVYSSGFIAQESSQPVLNRLSQPVLLLTGLSRVASIAIDLHSRYMFVTAQEGVILRLGYDELLGIVPPGPLPVAVDMRALQRRGTAYASALPRWVHLLARRDTRARLQGVCALPAVASTMGPDGVRDLPAQWQQERVLAVDANRNLLLALTEEGVQPSDVDLAFSADVTWPHHMQCFETTGTGTSASLASATLFISEYLGRVWKVVLQRSNETGKFQLRSAGAPELLMDLAGFAASRRVRQILGNTTDADTHGRPFIDVN